MWINGESVTYLQAYGDVNEGMMPQWIVVILRDGTIKEPEALFYS